MDLIVIAAAFGIGGAAAAIVSLLYQIVRDLRVNKGESSSEARSRRNEITALLEKLIESASKRGDDCKALKVRRELEDILKAWADDLYR